ncbi:hypothetical protein BG015_008778 [Linnemannia schmuckeri]|uniref:Complex 1 LYR protein domain-containing protein n=1 Tax=Linnemannia schmuckeri TaxID=64567 RepID=A0A9P5S9E9_9FUNG|nr:hypothetical protein BG015_008778 [Linnemannia schmuckeri]
MSVVAHRSQVLTLYKDLLHHSSKFAAYNFRDYATDPAKIEALIRKAEQQLEVVKRQSVISQLYGGEKLVVENPKNQKIFRRH